MHGVHTSREGLSGMGPSGRFGPNPCYDSIGRRGGVLWDLLPPSMLVRGSLLGVGGRAAAWYFLHTQADPIFIEI